ncbi:MAG: MFS transporter [Rhodoferax sp.]|nr:MFS transporter [Rhodoferax sp.]
MCPNGHLLNDPGNVEVAKTTACANGMGVATTALYPICPIRVMKAASHPKALAGTLNVSGANAGIGFGAIVGGLAIPVWGPSSVGYVAALIAATAVFFIARLASRQSGPQS